MKFDLVSIKINKPVTDEQLRIYHDKFIKDTNHTMKELSKAYILENHPKSHFIKGSFVTKKINPKISLVYGELKDEFHKLQGRGVVSYFKKKIGQIGSHITSGVANIKKYLGPRLDGFNNMSTKTINQYGDMMIKSMQVYRTPLSSSINTFLNVLSLGKLNSIKKQYNIEDFYHIGLVCNIGNKNIICEKNSVVEIKDTFKTNKDTVIFNVDIMQNKQFNIKQMLDATRSNLGDKAFFEYDMLTHNCQHFVASMLASMDLLTEDVKDFVYQDLSSVIGAIPAFSKRVIRLATDIDASINKLSGKGDEEHRDMYKEGQAILNRNALPLNPKRIRGGVIDIIAGGSLPSVPMSGSGFHKYNVNELKQIVRAYKLHTLIKLGQKRESLLKDIEKHLIIKDDGKIYLISDNFNMPKMKEVKQPKMKEVKPIKEDKEQIANLIHEIKSKMNNDKYNNKIEQSIDKINLLFDKIEKSKVKSKVKPDVKPDVKPIKKIVVETIPDDVFKLPVLSKEQIVKIKSMIQKS